MILVGGGSEVTCWPTTYIFSIVHKYGELYYQPPIIQYNLVAHLANFLYQSLLLYIYIIILYYVRRECILIKCFTSIVSHNEEMRQFIEMMTIQFKSELTNTMYEER